MNAHTIFTAVFALFTVGCVELFEAAPSYEDCGAEYEDWADWCDAAYDYLDDCDEQLEDVEGYCDDVHDDLHDCEDYHGFGARQCDGYADQVDSCQTQWDDVQEQRTDALSQVRYACGNADDLAETCQEI